MAERKQPDPVRKRNRMIAKRIRMVYGSSLPAAAVKEIVTGQYKLNPTTAVKVAYEYQRARKDPRVREPQRLEVDDKFLHDTLERALKSPRTKSPKGR